LTGCTDGDACIDRAVGEREKGFRVDGKHGILQRWCGARPLFVRTHNLRVWLAFGCHSKTPKTRRFEDAARSEGKGLP
jgi:hypothetical protein